jgi:arylsulfatase A-like enzyme
VSGQLRRQGGEGASPGLGALATSCEAVVIFAVGCGQAPGRPPSVVLVVLDTTRADAVSVYGAVRGTTPAFDAIAARGVRYTAAYANANWTLPSHATMFTGLLPDAHHMVGPKARLPDTVPTLARLLHDAGYETLGVSENPWINDVNNLAAGFDRFSLVGGRGLIDVMPRAATRPQRPATPDAEVVEAVAAWRKTRAAERPYFLFVNLMDAHAPYEVRADNRFLPAGVDAAAARAVSQEVRDYLCHTDGRTHDLAVLHGLYLGDVAAADRKLAALRAELAEMPEESVLIVTSDHGELFGEHGLVGHAVGVWEPLLRVPLAVAGLPGVAPAVIDEPVQLADLLPSILGWARLAAPAGLSGRPLPLEPRQGGADRARIAEYADVPEGALSRELRAACGPGDRVFGDMRAIVKDALKLIWYADYPAALYDLRADAAEERDLAAERPDVVASLGRTLTEAVARETPPATDAASLHADPELRDRLRALGYVDVPQ